METLRKPRTDGLPPCDMSVGCSRPVTHIGDKGFVYCAEHARVRRRHSFESCRELRQWELKLIRAGQPVPSYRPVTKAEGARLIAEREAREAPPKF